MNDVNNSELITTVKSQKSKANWKLNTIIIMLSFVIIGLFGILGSMNQIYKKLNYIESIYILASTKTTNDEKSVNNFKVKKIAPIQ